MNAATESFQFPRQSQMFMAGFAFTVALAALIAFAIDGLVSMYFIPLYAVLPAICYYEGYMMVPVQLTALGSALIASFMLRFIFIQPEVDLVYNLAIVTLVSCVTFMVCRKIWPAINLGDK